MTTADMYEQAAEMADRFVGPYPADPDWQATYREAITRLTREYADLTRVPLRHGSPAARAAPSIAQSAWEDDARQWEASKRCRWQEQAERTARLSAK